MFKYIFVHVAPIVIVNVIDNIVRPGRHVAEPALLTEPRS